MRWLVYTLVALVALKIYAGDFMYRQATKAALLDAYGKQALSACRNDRSHPLNAVAPEMWTTPSRIEVMVGDLEAGNDVWQAARQLFQATSAKAFLLITPADRHSGITCSFDMSSGKTILRVPG